MLDDIRKESSPELTLEEKVTRLIEYTNMLNKRLEEVERHVGVMSGNISLASSALAGGLRHLEQLN